MGEEGGREAQGAYKYKQVQPPPFPKAKHSSCQLQNSDTSPKEEPDMPIC